MGSRRNGRGVTSDIPYINNEYEKEQLTGVKSLTRGEWVTIAKLGEEESESRSKLAKKAFTAVDIVSSALVCFFSKLSSNIIFIMLSMFASAGTGTSAGSA